MHIIIFIFFILKKTPVELFQTCGPVCDVVLLACDNLTQYHAVRKSERELFILTVCVRICICKREGERERERERERSTLNVCEHMCENMYA